MFEFIILATLVGRAPANDAEVRSCMELHLFLFGTGQYAGEDDTKGVRLKLSNGETVQCGPIWNGSGIPKIPAIEAKG